jgi:uncharacterized protein (TIGR00369 family)
MTSNPVSAILAGMEIERDSHCFCCGKDNERGLHLNFSYPREGTAETGLEVPLYFQGWRNMTHGGFLSTILDEVMAHACLYMQRPAVTAEITVKFLKPVRTGSRIRAVGEVVGIKKRVIDTKGTVYNASGEAAAQATARFIVVKHREEDPRA